jgi:ADP-heptose:LPS heptosyltransferase
MLKSIAEGRFTKVVMADEQKWTLTEYLYQLDTADFVISVDTSAIHFREGVGKPALGVYSSFTKESRTKYYIYTLSLDVKGNCPIQPCFKYDNSICPHITKESINVPCLSGESVSNQIESILINYLTTINDEPI